MGVPGVWPGGDPVLGGRADRSGGVRGQVRDRNGLDTAVQGVPEHIYIQHIYIYFTKVIYV